MKVFIPTRLLLCFCISVIVAQSSYGQLQCENDTSGLTSLIDLKFGSYLGFQGGLYPGGFNAVPIPHLSGGMGASRRIAPRNEAGEVDWFSGQVGFISLGASTAGNAFNHFKSLANVDEDVNSCIKFVNCTVGAKGIESMHDTIDSEWYWDDYVLQDLDTAGITAAQVQVAWIMVTSRMDTLLIWPDQPTAVADRYELLMGVLHAKFPNLQMVFVSGFHYGGYADPTKEFYEMIVEPSSYWNNWTVKWFIERQIEGDPDLKYKGPDKKSPWVGWGPHLWADGLRPNVTDGLYWDCLLDFKPDGGGYHLSTPGKEKEGELLLNFFKTSPLCKSWFRQSTRWDTCDSIMRMDAGDLSTDMNVNVFPNPSTGKFYIEVENPTNETAEIEVVNSIGQVILRRQMNGMEDYQLDEFDIAGASNGLYHVLLTSGTQTFTRSILVQR